jgi:hypothetical protein
MPSLTNGIDRRLAAEYQDHKGQGPQRVDREVHLEFPDGQDAGAKSQQTGTHDDARRRQATDTPRIGHRRRPHVVRRQRHRKKIAGDHHDDHQQRSQNRLPGHD